MSKTRNAARGVFSGTSSLLFLTGLFAAGLCAQTAEIAGRILDPSKGAVAKAKVTLTRADTGYQRATLSSEDGYYRFPLLAPGPYQVTAESEGFQTQTRSGITVETGIVSNI